jgi:hypothetical protein
MGEEVKMCGGFLAALCTYHRNEWHEYAFGVDTIRRYLREASVIDFYKRIVASPVGSGVTEPKYMNQQKVVYDLGKRSFLLAKRWIHTKTTAWAKTQKRLEELED